MQASPAQVEYTPPCTASTLITHVDVATAPTCVAPELPFSVSAVCPNREPCAKGRILLGLTSSGIVCKRPGVSQLASRFALYAAQPSSAASLQRSMARQVPADGRISCRRRCCDMPNMQPRLSAGPDAPRSPVSMAAFGRTEAYVQGWDIAPEQLQICRSSLDGSEVLLGSGQFGKVPLRSRLKARALCGRPSTARGIQSTVECWQGSGPRAGCDNKAGTSRAARAAEPRVCRLVESWNGRRSADAAI